MVRKNKAQELRAAPESTVTGLECALKLIERWPLPLPRPREPRSDRPRPVEAHRGLIRGGSHIRWCVGVGKEGCLGEYPDRTVEGRWVVGRRKRRAGIGVEHPARGELGHGFEVLEGGVPPNGVEGCPRDGERQVDVPVAIGHALTPAGQEPGQYDRLRPQVHPSPPLAPQELAGTRNHRRRRRIGPHRPLAARRLRCRQRRPRPLCRQIPRRRCDDHPRHREAQETGVRCLRGD